MTARVLTHDGEPLAEALVLPAPATAGAVVLARRAQRLVAYYFGEGGRDVLLERTDRSLEPGRIVATTWHPEGRRWYLQMA